MKKILSFLLLCIFSLQSVSAFSVSTITPQPARRGEPVTIQGQNLGGSGTLLLNNQQITPTSWTDNQVVFTVPSDGVSGTLTINDRSGNSVSSTTFQVTLPTSALSIQAISPATFTEGTIVDIYGAGFGANPKTNTQVCFSDTLCSAIGSLGQMVVSWSDTKVTIQVPRLSLPSTGKIMLSVFPESPTTPIWLDSPTYTFQSSKPVITSFSPVDIIPADTVITVTGNNFGNSYVYGKNQICLNGQCMGDTYIDQYLVSWSNTEIKLRVPYTGFYGPTTLTLNVWKYVDKATNLDVYLPAFYSINVMLPPDPVISQITPLSLTPDQTVITVTGSGFGSSYLPGKNQICFGESCISDKLIGNYLYSWSDKEIKVKAPGFVDNYNSPQLLLRLYLPSKNIYTHVAANVLFSVKHVPNISQYYPVMESGSTYTITGRAFGVNAGTVTVGDTQMKVVSWTDTRISFQTPAVGLADDLVVTSSEGSRSAGIPVSIKYYNLYSQDTYSRYQWYFENLSIKDAWNITTGNSDVTVAVIDSGVNINHEDLAGNIWKNTKEISGNGIDDDHNGYIDDINGWDFVRNSNSMKPITDHGTMVASVIAAKKDNGIGLAGVAPGVKIMPLNVMAVGNSTDAYIDVDASLQAVKYAVDNGAKIINMSFGGAYSDTFNAVLKYAYDNNVLVVVAAGNEGVDLALSKKSPVCNDLTQNIVMGIAALTKSFSKASFSSYGPCIDASLPGEEIVVASMSAGKDVYSVADGTSFAAPLFSGMAALLRSHHPDWNVAQISYALLHNGYGIDQVNTAYARKLGIMPNVYRALLTAAPGVEYTYSPRTSLTIAPTNQVIEVNPPEAQPITIPGPSTNNTNGDTLNDIFLDIPSNHYYGTAIKYLKAAQILSGYPDGTFRAENPVNRAEFLKIILESAKADIPSSYANCFPDIHTEWFAKYVCYAKAKGIIQGYPDGNFKPANTINKVESLKVLARAFNLSTNVKTTSFKDVDAAAWYAPFVITGETLNLLEEKGQTNYNPAALMKRGSISEILYRYLYMKEKNYTSFHL